MSKAVRRGQQQECGTHMGTCSGRKTPKNSRQKRIKELGQAVYERVTRFMSFPCSSIEASKSRASGDHL